MRCPQCHGRNLRIGVVLTGSMTCRFGVDHPVEVLEATEFDSFWNPEGDCECLSCSWTGIVADAAETEADLEHIAAYDLQELRALENDVASGDCPDELVQHVRRLIESVRRLKALWEVAQRARRKGSGRNGRMSVDDTTIV
ncbi:MAG: hypothetical protein KF774_04440 [Planctomyces sp.]|nr:hypothetical protein [Planctomyces sp.]